MDLKFISKQRKQSYLFLALSVAHMLYFLSTGQATIYYFVYLFWFEELIRYAFEMSYYNRFQQKIEGYRNFDRFKSARLGFLFVLWWLIYIIYCKIFVTGADEYAFNKGILHFENTWFNSYLVLSVFRIAFFWRKQTKIAHQVEQVYIDYSENGIWVMTISILVGPYTALMATDPADDFTYNTILIVAIPFIALKTLIEYRIIQLRYKKGIEHTQLEKEAAEKNKAVTKYQNVQAGTINLENIDKGLASHARCIVHQEQIN